MSQKIQCATRQDVANMAGVSVTIVSYVMNGNRYVSQDKRERVLRAAKKLNYTPNNVALALRGKDSGQLLFIVDNPANERLSYMMSRMERWSYEKKHAVVTQCAVRNESEFVRQMIRRRFDGIIISSMILSEDYIQEFVDAGIPTVLLLTREYHKVRGAAKIGTGLYSGEKQAVRFLRERGAKSFLYLDRISAQNHFSDLNDTRLRGFADALTEAGEAWEHRVVTGCRTEEETQQKVAEAVRELRVDAVIGRNDRMACVALRQLRQMGLRVPEDIQVIGLDDTSVCRYVTPALTSIRLDDDEIGKYAIELIYDLRAGGETPPTRHFAPSIIERDSTR